MRIKLADFNILTALGSKLDGVFNETVEIKDRTEIYGFTDFVNRLIKKETIIFVEKLEDEISVTAVILAQIMFLLIM